MPFANAPAITLAPARNGATDPATVADRVTARAAFLLAGDVFVVSTGHVHRRES